MFNPALDEKLLKNLKLLGRLSLISHGLGYIAVMTGLYILFGYSLAITSRYSYTPFYSFPAEAIGLVAAMVIASTALFGTGIFVMRTGTKIGKGTITKFSIFMPILLFSIFLITVGITGIIAYGKIGSNYYGSDLLNTSILSIISGILLIAGSIIYWSNSSTPKLTGAIVGIVAIGLLIAGGAQAQNSVFNLKNIYFAELTGSGLVTSGFVVAGIAAMAYVFLRNTKFVQISYLIAVAGFILYSIGIIMATLGMLFSPIWNIPGEGLVLLLSIVVGVIILAVSGFLILASGGIGTAYYLRQLIGSVQSQAETKETTMPHVDVMFCSKCGASVDSDAEYCKKCGTKIKS